MALAREDVPRRFATSSSILPEVWPRPYLGILLGFRVRVSSAAAWNLGPLAKRFQKPRAFFTFLLAAHLLKGV